MTKTMRRILTIISILFCIICYVMAIKKFDVRIFMPFAAAAMALMTTAIMHP